MSKSTTQIACQFSLMAYTFTVTVVKVLYLVTGQAAAFLFKHNVVQNRLKVWCR